MYPKDIIWTLNYHTQSFRRRAQQSRINIKFRFDSKTRVLKIRAPINPQYLKERALEDVEEAKKYMATLIDQVEDVDEVAQSKDESKDEYTVKFIPS